MPYHETPTINFGKALNAAPIEGWTSHLLSPFKGILNEAECAVTKMTFRERSKADQQYIRADFERFFEWLGPQHIVFYSHKDFDAKHDSEYRCVEMVPEIRNTSLVQYVDDFLWEKHLPALFHLQRECFVILNFDMTAHITHKAEFIGLPEFDILKWVELP